MMEIKLTRSKIAIIDDEDFVRVKMYKWRAVSSNNKWYAVVTIKNEYGKWITMSMHRLLTEAYDGVQVDHKNNNGLDNRMDNLRICHKSGQNNYNTSKRYGTTSQYKGVCWYKKYKCWRVQISFEHKKHHLGYFVSEVKAAKAYNQAAIRYFGEFAQLNLI